ncbi:hypothetical protein EDB89DRAFT_45227 [Lactarius sanguifluus]|nr:hypothetical protein EDB89DRAFT_45227 [Lactarius sanguifluus]
MRRTVQSPLVLDVIRSSWRLGQGPVVQISAVSAPAPDFLHPTTYSGTSAQAYPPPSHATLMSGPIFEPLVPLVPLPSVPHLFLALTDFWGHVRPTTPEFRCLPPWHTLSPAFFPSAAVVFVFLIRTFYTSLVRRLAVCNYKGAVRLACRGVLAIQFRFLYVHILMCPYRSRHRNPLRPQDPTARDLVEMSKITTK